LRFIPNTNPESPRERKNELSKLEDIKNALKNKEIHKQNFIEVTKVDVEDLDDIELSRTNVITNQIIDNLFWVIYRHHAPRSSSNFLMVAIVFLMIIEAVCSDSTDLPGPTDLLRVRQPGFRLEQREPQLLLGARDSFGTAASSGLQSDHGTAGGSFEFISTLRTGRSR
jgi:hypothetical protein